MKENIVKKENTKHASMKRREKRRVLKLPSGISNILLNKILEKKIGKVKKDCDRARKRG